MSIHDTLLDRFRAVVDLEIAAAGGKAADGYRAVAEKTRLGYDYIYQIYKGKPAHKPKRPSLEAMEAIERAYGRPESGAAATDLQSLPARVTPKEALAVLQAEIDKANPLVHIEHAWPFSQIKRDQWESLTPEQKTIVEGVALSILAAQHAAGASACHTEKRQATG